MPLKRAVTEFGKTYKDRFALRTYPGTSVPIFIFILVSRQISVWIDHPDRGYARVIPPVV